MTADAFRGNEKVKPGRGFESTTTSSFFESKTREEKDSKQALNGENFSTKRSIQIAEKDPESFLKQLFRKIMRGG